MNDPDPKAAAVLLFLAMMSLFLLTYELASLALAALRA